MPLPRTILRAARALLLTPLTVVAWRADAAPVDLEMKVKAAFVFNFVKFVTWPPDHAPAAGEPYVLCMIDAPDFSRAVSETVRNKVVEGHGVTVRSLVRGEPAAACHVVYASDRDPAAAAASLQGTAGHGVLSVHEASEPFPTGVVRFFIEDRRVRFEVNTTAVAAEHLQLSSRLLGVAERVQMPAP